MKVWFRWLSYAQPVSFGFEALLSNECEFERRASVSAQADLGSIVRRLNVPCASLVPSGPAYPGVAVANQVCSVAGAQPGSAIVIGADYLQATFGYTYSHTWRNFGIM